MVSTARRLLMSTTRGEYASSARQDERNELFHVPPPAFCFDSASQQKETLMISVENQYERVKRVNKLLYSLWRCRCCQEGFAWRSARSVHPEAPKAKAAHWPKIQVDFEFEIDF
jgi:hypothetical protein